MNRLRPPEISCALVAICAVLSASACGKSSRKSSGQSSKQATKRQTAQYINELDRVHKGVEDASNRYEGVTRPSPHIPEKLKSARVELAKSLARWEKELAKVTAPYAAAKDFHAAYLEHMKRYLGFLRAGLTVDTALATKKPGQPPVEALRRKLTTVLKAFEEATFRMLKERKKLTRQVGI